MLSMNAYTREYLDECRGTLDAQVAAFGAVASVADDLKGGDKARLGAAVAALEPVFFTNLVLVLENYFVHRMRAMEGKDGNPLNEVRLLCASLMSNGGRLVGDKQIKLDPAKSVLGYRVGDEIRLGRTDFEALAKAFFTELDSKYVPA